MQDPTREDDSFFTLPASEYRLDPIEFETYLQEAFYYIDEDKRMQAYKALMAGDYCECGKLIGEGFGNFCEYRSQNQTYEADQ